MQNLAKGLVTGIGSTYGHWHPGDMTIWAHKLHMPNTTWLHLIKSPSQWYDSQTLCKFSINIQIDQNPMEKREVRISWRHSRKELEVTIAIANLLVA